MELLAAKLPELLELLLLLQLGLALLPPLLLLLLAALLDRSLELETPALLLLEELKCLFFGLLDLLVEDLVFAVLHVAQDLGLALNEPLARLLLLAELLLLLVLLELV